MSYHGSHLTKCILVNYLNINFIYGCKNLVRHSSVWIQLAQVRGLVLGSYEQCTVLSGSTEGGECLD
jgi:hypothetical protein